MACHGRDGAMGMDDVTSISVVMPIKNREHHVVHAIASIFRQSHPVREIIIVNDGSTDGTRVVLDRMAAENPIVRPVHLEMSGGAAAARNIGIAHATSAWVAFLDSDDAWAPEKLERQLELARRDPATVGVFTGIRYVETIGEAGGAVYDYAPKVEITLETLRQLNHLSSTSTALVRRDALLAVGGFDKTLPSCQDWDLWLQLAERGRLALIPDPLTSCSFGNSDRISRNFKSVIAGHQIVFDKIYRADPRPSAVRLNRSYHKARLAQIYLLDLENPWIGLKYAAASLFEQPTAFGWSLFRDAFLGVARTARKRLLPR